MATPPGEASPRGARSLSGSQRAELRVTALALPEGWVVTYNDYTGQVALLPRAYLRPCEANMERDGRGGARFSRRRL